MSVAPRVPQTVPELHEYVIDELDALRDEVAAAIATAGVEDSQLREQLVATMEDLSTAVSTLVESTKDMDQRIDKLESTWETSAEKVREWVNYWLIPTFALEIVLKDWETMPGFVSELQALNIAFEHMRSKKAHGFDPVNWHSHLNSMVDRLQILRSRYQERERGSRTGISDLLARPCR